MNRSALLVMAKRPFPGRTKTRLMPLLSPEEAAELYACFLRDTLNLVRAIPNVTPFIAFAPPDQETAAYFHELAPDMKQLAQMGASLAERLDHVLTATSHQGFGQVVAVNSDSPTLPSAYLTQAFAHLEAPTTDVVLGPCDDGGYYLIGWKRPCPHLVRDVRMSTNHVLQDTLTIAAQEKWRVSLLPSWYDVDSPSELRQLQADLVDKPDVAPHTRCFLHKLRGSMLDESGVG